MNKGNQDKPVKAPAPAAKPRKKSKKKRARTVWKVIGTLFLVGCITGVMVLGALYYYVVNYLDPQMNVDLSSYKLAQTSYVYYTDSEGKDHILETLYDTENREWVDLASIPKHMQNAAVAIEDERFWVHNGVDWKRTIAAVLNLFTGGSSRFGGSTISQQVVKNVTGEDDYSMMRKIEEILRALNLNKKYSRSEILEFYLNTAFFSQNTNGVQSAAKVYFDKDASELSLAESASIIGITKYPGLYDPFRNPDKNKERQETVLWKMLELEMITREEYDAAKAEQLVFQKEKQQQQLSQVQSWYVDRVIDEVLEDLKTQKGYTTAYSTNLLYTGGLRIYAAIDREVQAVLDEVFTDMSSFPELKGEEQPQASMVIMDPSNGRVLGIAGARGEKTGARLFNYATDAKRQPGSTIKPVAVYAPGIEYNVLSQGSVFDDTPVDVETRWPRNYDTSYAAYTGLMDVKTGVYKSVNTIAVRSLMELGVENSYKFMTENLGFTTLVSRSIIGGKVMTDIALSPLALGGLTYGVTNLELTAAYCTFANKGVYNKPYTYTRVEAYDGTVLLEHQDNPQTAMSEQTAYLVNELLQGVVSYGTGTPAQLSNMAVAGKTGTTSDDVDRWFVGYTPYYVGVVWFGYDQPKTIRYSGTNPALQGWRKVMTPLHKELPYRSFASQPSGIVSASYCLDSGMVPTDLCRSDPRGSRVATANYKKGNEPTVPCEVHVSARLCSETNMIASPYCAHTHTTSMLNFRREFPYNIAVIDAQYTYLPMDATTELPPDSSMAVYQNLLAPGTSPGYSPGTENPMNQLCVLHYGYPGTTDRVEPGDAQDPSDPNYPYDPNDPSGSNPYDPSHSGQSSGQTQPGESSGTQSGVNPYDPGYQLNPPGQLNPPDHQAGGTTGGTTAPTTAPTAPSTTERDDDSTALPDGL